MYLIAIVLLKHLFYIVTTLFFHVQTHGQQYYLKGEVRDEAGKLLSNISIQHVKSGYLYYSGQSGAFGLNFKTKTDSLLFFGEEYLEQKILADASRYLTVTLKRKPKGTASPYKLASMTENLKREAQQQWFAGDETYTSIIENGFINSATHPVTGVTLNVDRASYSNVRRFLNMNTIVPPDAIRVEEMLNYFNFGYSEPLGGKVFDISSVLTECPWNSSNRLLFSTIKSKKLSLDSLPPTHLVFLIDVSGSMDMANRLPLLKAGFRGLVNNLRAKDSVSIVVYGGTVGILLDATSGDEKQKIFNVIDSLEPGGGTPGESGIKLAYSVARKHFLKEGNNRVILATDGDFNVGLRSEADLEALIEEQSKAGIYLTCLGVGMGNYKDSKIQVLAQKGNGNFAYLDSYAEAEKVLMKEFMQTLYAVADDAYLNVQFNPSFVKEYRLLGFDNKVGAIKDSLAIIEGGTIGSAFSILIAFEIVPSNTWEEDVKIIKPAKFLLSYKIPMRGTLHQEKIEPALRLVPLGQVDKSYQFAAAVVMFGSLLRDSKLLKNSNWNDVATLAGRSVDPSHPSQKEFLLLIQKAKDIYSKKKKGKFAVFN